MALAFGAALSAAWASGTASGHFSETMHADCATTTPMWKCADRASYESELKGAQQFFSALSVPSLDVLSSRQVSDGRVVQRLHHLERPIPPVEQADHVPSRPLQIRAQGAPNELEPP